jgi:hypothetical protein
MDLYVVHEQRQSKAIHLDNNSAGAITPAIMRLADFYT